MRQRPARLLPFARRGRNSDPETAARGAIRGRAGPDAAAGGPRPHHRLCRQHAVARLHERNPDQPDLEQGVHPNACEQGLIGNGITVFFALSPVTAVITALVAVIHALFSFHTPKAWMAGTSPAMTERGNRIASFALRLAMTAPAACTHEHRSKEFQGSRRIFVRNRCLTL